jgi:predicted ATP-dependent endonuclease of OLD family
MRIESVTIKNLRCIKDSVANLGPYTCIVGPNGAGKSTILCALNIFFREVENSPTNVTTLVSEDFYLHEVKERIEITVTFVDLNVEALDDFKDYVRQGKLVISAVADFDTNSGAAQVRQFGQRMGMDNLKPFFKAYGDGASAGDLKAIFEGLERSDPAIAALKLKKTKDGIYDGLKGYEASKPAECVLMPSEDQFYGATRGANKLAKYVQWIYIPAVKSASDEQSETRSGALGKLLARTVRAKMDFGAEVDRLQKEAREQYQKMLDDNEAILSDISSSLQSRLAEWAHPEASIRVIWEADSAKSVRVEQPLAGILAGESGFEGKLARLGHGFQRSYLLALLQELATTDDSNGPTLILACEEPELYQHPPQARHLAGVFEKLADDNSQIIVTTHSPYFVSGKSFESIRLVRREGNARCATIRQYSYDELAARFAVVVGEPLRTQTAAAAKLHQALQPALNEMFFTQRLVLVEGLEDVAYIHAWLVLTDKWQAYRRSGAYVVPANGKSEMIRPAIVAQGLQIPLLAVFDADADKIARPEVRTRHHRDNAALIRIFGGDDSDLFPTGILWLDNLVIWPSDLADQVEREVVAALGAQGAEQFVLMQNKARADAGNAGDLEKNVVYIGNLLAEIRASKATSLILDKLCDKVINFGSAPLPFPKGV